MRGFRACDSVVRPDAVPATGGDDRTMVYAEHRQEKLPVPFETATVGDAMSRGVLSCPPETPLRVVARMMATYGVHAIFVFEPTDEDDEAPRLWAVVSDLDLVAATQLDLDTLTAGATAVTPLGRQPDGAVRDLAPRGHRTRLTPPHRRHLDARHRASGRGRSRSPRNLRLRVNSIV